MEHNSYDNLEIKLQEEINLSTALFDFVLTGKIVHRILL